MSKATAKKGAIYIRTIETVFIRGYQSEATRFDFSRDDLARAAAEAGLEIRGDDEVAAKNLGDIVYTFRFRRAFPPAITSTAPPGKMWIIMGKGDAAYEFRLITKPALARDPGLFTTKLHDATPEIVRRFNLSDEQALLSRIRYNRLIDVFCRCVAHSLQNHLRTKVKSIGQIEIDELYVGANRQGQHFIIPVQAKTPRDKLGVSQLMQDLEYCRLVHPDLQARPIGAQMTVRHDGIRRFEEIAMFEFETRDTGDDIIINKVAERHFLLLNYSEIGTTDFREASGRLDTDE